MFGDVLDALRKEIADSLASLEAIGRGGGDVAAARAAEDIAPEERAARQLDLADFLRRIRGKRALAEELAAYRGTTVEDELRALRDAELADEERALRERVGRLSGLKKAALAGLGIGGAALGGLALYNYLSGRQSSAPSPSSPFNSLPPSSPYNNNYINPTPINASFPGAEEYTLPNPYPTSPATLLNPPYKSAKYALSSSAVSPNNSPIAIYPSPMLVLLLVIVVV